MTTFATDTSAGLALDDQERAAWAHYADTLRTLGTVAYAEAEPPAWEHLQEELAEVVLARAHAALDAPAF